MSASIPPPVYSIGYQLRDLEEVLSELIAAGVGALVDVRETAWSYKKGFSKSQLKQGLEEAGIEYVHAQFVGNPKAIRKAAATHEECLIAYSDYLSQHPELVEEFNVLIAEFERKGKSVCLMCYERHPDDCHRSIVLRYWEAFVGDNVDARHLGVGGAPRFIEGRVDLAVPLCAPSAA